MMYQLFGGKAAKPAEKLEIVRPKTYEIFSDDWELDANSALSVSLLGKTQTKAVFSLQSLRTTQQSFSAPSKTITRVVIAKVPARLRACERMLFNDWLYCLFLYSFF